MPIDITVAEIFVTEQMERKKKKKENKREREKERKNYSENQTNRTLALRLWIKSFRICLVLSKQYTNATDTQTDGRTDTQTPHDCTGRTYAYRAAKIEVLNDWHSSQE